MERTKKPIAFLDTHVALWLFDRETGKFSSRAKAFMETAQLCISPVILLEVQYLYEIKRIIHRPGIVLRWLQQRLNVKIAQTPFASVVHSALAVSWTRDAFDRIIVAASQAESASLITSDKEIRRHYSHSVW